MENSNINTGNKFQSQNSHYSDKAMKLTAHELKNMDWAEGLIKQAEEIMNCEEIAMQKPMVKFKKTKKIKSNLTVRFVKMLIKLNYPPLKNYYNVI